MAEYKAGNIKRNGEWFKLRVDDGGNWLADAAGRTLKHPTRAKLITDIDRVMRLEKKAVHIPVTVVEGKNNGYLKLKHGVVTGIHAGTGNLTVAWDIGGNGQLTISATGYSTDDVLRRLTLAEEGELTRAVKEAYDAGEYMRNYINRLHIYKGTRGLADQVEAELKKESP
jgi:hypothetical protein